MFIKQLYTSCLSEAAYYIESEGEAAVIDPLRETEPYLALAAERKATIKYVFETHFLEQAGDHLPGTVKVVCDLLV